MLRYLVHTNNDFLWIVNIFEWPVGFQTSWTDSIERLAQRVAGDHVLVGFALHIRTEKLFWEKCHEYMTPLSLVEDWGTMFIRKDCTY
jgi:hypothetical protein